MPDRLEKFPPEVDILRTLTAQVDLSDAARARISQSAADLVRRIRDGSRPTMMEQFLGEYGLSSREGVALMCLAEAMLRVPDAPTMDALIEDKIAPSDWGRHMGEASSTLVNASTWALMLTGRVLDDDQPGLAGVLRGAIRRLGEPVIRAAVGRAMAEMGRQFVLGQTIDAAMDRARAQEAKGYTYSYDMLGEAAATEADARRYAQAYHDAIAGIAKGCGPRPVAENPGISIKLSALHPRYEVAQEARVMQELVPVVLDLALAARRAGMGLNIDAEEQDRLVLSQKVIEAVLADDGLAGWDGFGVVVQAYGKRAGAVIDWLHGLADRLDRRLMVRLVKGAYWDTEMKHAQVDGHPGFPLFTSKVATDVSYIACARKLLRYADRLYPQFATHNAHSVAAVLEMAQGERFEFQRLHGMGERLHDLVLQGHNVPCRIYAPVGAHRDLLAYLVRRLLENGANSSFVNQIVDEAVAPEEIAADPLEAWEQAQPPAGLAAPAEIFGARANSTGFDLSDEATLDRIEAARQAQIPDGGPITKRPGNGPAHPVHDPASGTVVAQATDADQDTVAHALEDAAPWQADPADRAAMLRRAADLYERDFGPLFACLAREAGKTLPDAVGELREAVDFLRFYADEAERLPARAPLGVVTAISPWNFPLAIFTGQISAALAAGNAVLAKPAEQTPLVAAMAVRLLREAGVPAAALQLLPGAGSVVGAALTSDPRVNGIVFTGSTATAKRIQRSMAQHLAPGAPLIAETGGLNAMIVDSTALLEQAVRDIITSAFQSAGQRCSALRCLYVQEDIAAPLTEMIQGAMDLLQVGDPWHLSTDVGPVIDAPARESILAHIAQSEVLHQSAAPEGFVSPTLIRVPGIAALEREVFGPVLHIATFQAHELDAVIDAVNHSGYGLTFGLHSRIDARVQHVADRVHAGNLYVNRNQIGAVVGSQPFGGEALSGTGPKAGGPNYVARFQASPAPETAVEAWPAAASDLQGALSQCDTSDALPQVQCPGPTGEANTLRLVARPPLLCLGPGPQAARAQADAVRALGGQAVEVDGTVSPDVLAHLDGIAGALYWGADGGPYAQAMAQREGPILPLITGRPDQAHVTHERHLCIDTTAAGGNAALLAG